MRYRLARTIPVLLLCGFSLQCSHSPKHRSSEFIPTSCQGDPRPSDSKVNSSTPTTTHQKFMAAVFQGDLPKAEELLKGGHDLQHKDPYGLSYLHLAAGTENSEMIEFLIDRGLSVQLVTEKRKTTPAHSAARWGKLNSLKTLIKHGASIRAKDSNGKTPMDIAAEEGHSEVVDYLKGLL